jgi:hypothetical protein
MRKFLSLALSVLLAVASLTAAPRSSNIGSPKGFAGKVYDSTLALYGERNIKAVDEATGIVIQLPPIVHFLCTTQVVGHQGDEYVLISAGHCVGLNPPDVTYSVSEEIGGPRMPVEVVKFEFDAKYDFSVFLLKSKKQYPVERIGDENGARMGDKVLVMNFSAGIGKQLSQGVISSKSLGPAEHCKGCDGQFMVQIFGGGGASGSAVISLRTHKIVGLIVSQFGVNVGLMAEPISWLHQFLLSEPPVATPQAGSTE